MPKYEDMYKPTVRKRTLKIVATGKDEFEIYYMSTYVFGLSKTEVIKQLGRDLDVIASWRKEL